MCTAASAPLKIPESQTEAVLNKTRAAQPTLLTLVWGRGAYVRRKLEECLHA
jgi:hypothetical protein